MKNMTFHTAFHGLSCEKTNKNAIIFFLEVQLKYMYVSTGEQATVYHTDNISYIYMCVCIRHAAVVSIKNLNIVGKTDVAINIKMKKGRCSIFTAWASYQVGEIVGYACAGNAEVVFPAPTSKEISS